MVDLSDPRDEQGPGSPFARELNAKTGEHMAIALNPNQAVGARQPNIRIADVALESEHAHVVALIPAYNEERFIGSVVLKAQHHADVVIVIDDGSSDDTAALAEEAGALVLRHLQNQGKGAALNTGFNKARELCPDVVVVMDADGQHVAEELPLVATPVLAGEADIVVGSRYLVKKSHVPTHRVLGHHVFNFVTNQASGVSVTDSQSGFRAFSRRALDAISFHSRGFSVECEMQFLAHEYGLKVIEVPITIHYYDKPKRNVMSHGLMVLNGVLRLAGQYRPLLFLGVPGTLLLMLGLMWGLYVVDIYERSRTLAQGYALISVMLAVMGTLTLLTGVILHSVRALILSLVHTTE